MREGNRQRDVSTKVTSFAIRALENQQWVFPALWDAHGLDETVLRSNGQWITWEAYMRFLVTVAGADQSHENHRHIGGLLMTQATTTPFRHLGHLLGGAHALFEATYGWVLTSNVRVLDVRLHRKGAHRLVVEMRLDPSCGSGLAFFHSAAGTMSRVPHVLGQGTATVAAEIDSHHARYEVGLPPSTSLVARTRRAWRALADRSGLDVAVEELQEAMEGSAAQLREVNARLVASEDRWRALTANLPGVVTVVDANLRVEGVYGADIPPDDHMKGTDVQLTVGPEERPILRALLRRVFEHGEQVNYEASAPATVGKPAWWAARAGPLPGPIPRAVIVAIDVTERRQAQEDLRASEARLLQAQKMDAIGRLAGGLAHDFNNVLTAVRGQSELLAECREDDREVQRTVGAILEAVQRAQGLTERLLSYGRPRDVQRGVVDLNGVVRQAGELLQRVIGADVALQTELLEEPVPVRADSIQLQQVVLNLVVNARDALPNGGTVAIATGVTPSEEGARCWLRVTDDGVGMEEAVRLRILEPFFTTKEVGLGTGLGLSTVYWIAQNANGDVEIESAPSAGTTVQVWFPRASGPIDAVEAVEKRGISSRGPMASGRETILLAEDEPDVREMVREMLESHGYRVLACANGAMALSVAASHDGPIDLLLTDMVMPEMGGRALAQQLTARFEHLPVLLMSGYTNEDPSVLADTVACFTYVQKPFGLRQLTTEVRRLLDASRRARE